MAQWIRWKWLRMRGMRQWFLFTKSETFFVTGFSEPPKMIGEMARHESSTFSAWKLSEFRRKQHEALVYADLNKSIENYWEVLAKNGGGGLDNGK